jgi:hypothetical protein
LQVHIGEGAVNGGGNRCQVIGFGEVGNFKTKYQVLAYACFNIESIGIGVAGINRKSAALQGSAEVLVGVACLGLALLQVNNRGALRNTGDQDEECCKNKSFS